MREVLDQRQHGNSRAELAVEVYLRRLVQEVAAMTASLGGVDVLAFTGGVGEHATTVRAEAAERLRFLGVVVDDDHNATVSGRDADLTASGAEVCTVVVATREDLEVARQVRTLLPTS